MFENVDGRKTDAGVTGILIAHLGALGSGELKTHTKTCNMVNIIYNTHLTHFNRGF